MFFLKRFLIARGWENRVDLLSVLGLEDEYLWLETYYNFGLILGTIIRHYPRVVFLIHFVMKEFGIFMSVLSERQTFGLARYYDLDLVFETMNGHYTHIVFFFQFIAKRRHIWILEEDKHLDLQAITTWVWHSRLWLEFTPR